MTLWVLGLALIGFLLLAPRVGGVASWRRRRAAIQREQAEDALKHLLEQEYRGRAASFPSLAGALRLSDAALMRLVDRLAVQGLVQTKGQEFRLTPEGERLAIQVVRAHRLLERYLADEARLPLKMVHQEAERREHALTREQVDQLDASLGHPEVDPHGDPIPTREGYLAPATGTPATDWPVGAAARIVHLEDEPALAYAQIVATGLRVGELVRLLESTPERVLLSNGESESLLAPAVAANVFLAAVPETVPADEGVIPLSKLEARERAEVIGLSDTCQGFTRRRLLDLGFTPGASLAAELRTFAGDPRAYRIRGTLVALRRDQADLVLVKAVR